MVYLPNTLLSSLQVACSTISHSSRFEVIYQLMAHMSPSLIYLQPKIQTIFLKLVASTTLLVSAVCLRMVRWPAEVKYLR
ncbi:hypothetical protein PHET_11459 [Paragonimus heterotremus]|uniref:Uncharacterized protein n=1 Tax=Paragonimus heterotremus TaxID=100268 RepID=A0A8J4WSD6_9TREM|nr:hypothetical protein PHET_11459 [Paragonimus heterotremus]